MLRFRRGIARFDPGLRVCNQIFAAAMKTEMSWETIINIPAWSSLSRVTANPAQVLPGIYQVADGAYLVTQTYDRSLEEGIAGSPFTTLAVWAGGEDALRRCINSDASIYVPSPTKIPPPTILCGTQGIYSELELKLTSSES